MSAASPSSQPTTSESTKATGIRPERFIVRALIGILIVVMVIELVAYGRLLLAQRQLSAELAKAEQGNYQIVKKNVDEMFGNRVPDESKSVKVAVGEERYDMYYYWGLLKERPLCVHYGVAGMNSEPEVIEVRTSIPDEVLAAQ